MVLPYGICFVTFSARRGFDFDPVPIEVLFFIYLCH